MANGSDSKNDKKDPQDAEATSTLTERERKADAGVESSADDEESFETRLQQVRKLIQEIPIAMLTTTDWSGQLRSRPMAIQQIENDNKLYLITNEDSGKVLAIRTDQNVNVVCADHCNSRYLSISGSARISQDRAKIHELWSPVMKAWFPDGPETPEVCLLVIEIEDAEYWDAPKGKWIQLLKIARAALTGRRYEAAPGEHGEIHIPHKH